MEFRGFPNPSHSLTPFLGAMLSSHRNYIFNIFVHTMGSIIIIGSIKSERKGERCEWAETKNAWTDTFEFKLISRLREDKNRIDCAYIVKRKNDFFSSLCHVVISVQPAPSSTKCRINNNNNFSFRFDLLMNEQQTHSQSIATMQSIILNFSSELFAFFGLANIDIFTFFALRTLCFDAFCTHPLRKREKRCDSMCPGRRYSLHTE